MCIKSNLQQHIRNLTNDGEVVAKFLVETVQGKTPGAKACHQMEAAKLLNRYGLTGDDEPSQFWGLIPTPEELAEKKGTEEPQPVRPEPVEGRVCRTENSQLNTHNSPVTHLDILNYEIAHLIRKETADGHTIAEFLSHVMTRQDKPFTPKKFRIRHIDRFAAAMEILRRGHGHFGRKRKLVVDANDDNNHDTNDYDTLHTDLAKRMREYSEHGTDAIRFLLDVMSHEDPDEPYTWHHRVSAAQELLRRGWDTNYDKVTPEMLQAYWRNQQSPRLSVGQKKHLAGLPTTLNDYDQYDTKDYQAIADAIREQEDLETISPIKKSPLSPRERARVRGNHKTPSPSTKQTIDEEEQDRISSPSCAPMSVPLDLDDDDFKPNCYYEPLPPEDQAIFDYQTQIESGEYKEGEITIVPPSEEARRDYAIALREIKEAAKAEGIPLLPNPLAGTLRHPNIRSP